MYRDIDVDGKKVTAHLEKDGDYRHNIKLTTWVDEIGDCQISFGSDEWTEEESNKVFNSVIIEEAASALVKDMEGLLGE